MIHLSPVQHWCSVRVTITSLTKTFLLFRLAGRSVSRELPSSHCRNIWQMLESQVKAVNTSIIFLFFIWNRCASILSRLFSLSGTSEALWILPGFLHICKHVLILITEKPKSLKIQTSHQLQVTQPSDTKPYLSPKKSSTLLQCMFFTWIWAFALHLVHQQSLLLPVTDNTVVFTKLQYELNMNTHVPTVSIW